jgi:CheY-like chemotaxis protein
MRAVACHAPPRVLVAEDDPEMRRLVVEALQRDGFDVIEACDGGRLLVRITSAYAHPEAQVDLIISDIRMPICTGLQILKGLRDARWTTPVILMTAFSDEGVRANANALDAVLFDKPFAIDDLRTAVATLLG